MNAVLIGSVSSSAAALRGLHRGGLPFVGVCAFRHRPNVSDFVDLSQIASEMHVPYITFDKVIEPAVFDFIKQQKPDWLFVIGFSQLVPVEMRNLARAGAIGFHPTPLPEGRGRAPVAWTILLNRPAAANLFFLTDEPDAGDIIEQRPVPVLPDDYASDLIERTNSVLEQMCADLAPAFASGNVPRTPQDNSRASTYPRRRPEDGLIDWNQSAAEIYRLVRAVSRPYPGAFTFRQGQKLMIWRANPHPANDMTHAPGAVISIAGGIPIIQTASGSLALTDIQWINAPTAELQAGDRFI